MSFSSGTSGGRDFDLNCAGGVTQVWEIVAGKEGGKPLSLVVAVREGAEFDLGKKFWAVGEESGAA